MFHRVKKFAVEAGSRVAGACLLSLSLIAAPAAAATYDAGTSPRSPSAMSLNGGASTRLVSGQPAVEIPGQPSGLQIDLDEVLDLLTFKVHTVFERRNGTIVERTVPAIVGVPALVNVRGGLLPEILVEVLPLPPNLVTVSFVRLPTALGRMDVLAEVLVDVPGGVGASFGFDAQQGDMPPAVNTNLTFALAGEATSIDLFLNTGFPDATPGLAVIGAVFQKGAGGAQIDPTAVRADLAPVPGSLHVAVDADNSELASTFDVAVESGRATTLTVEAHHVRGPQAQDVEAVIDMLPQTVAVHFDENASRHQRIDYAASAPIARVDAVLRGSTDGVVDRRIEAHLEEVPTALEGTIEGTHITLTAAQPIGVAEVGFAASDVSPFPSDVAEPLYVNAELDSAADDGVLRVAAVRVPGVRSVAVDTGDPLIVDLDSAGGALFARVTDTRPGGVPFSLEAMVDALPAATRVEFSPSAGILSYTGGVPVTRATASVHEPAGFGFAGTAGAVPTRLELTVEEIPGDIALSFTPAGESDDGEVVLIDFQTGDAGIGRITGLLTSDEPPVSSLPADADGVIVEDFANRFVALARVSGLRHLEVVSGGAPIEDPGQPVDARPLVRARVDTTAGRPFVARIDRHGAGGPEFLRAEVSALPPNMRLAMAAFDVIPCTLVEEALRELFTFPEGHPLEMEFFGCQANRVVDNVIVLDFDPDLNGIFDGPAVDGAGNPLDVSHRLGTQVSYRSGQVPPDVTVDVTMESDLGGLPNPLFARMREVPRIVDLCFATMEACTTETEVPAPPRGNLLSGGGLTFEFTAIEPVVLDLFLCQAPATGNCAFTGDVTVDLAQLESGILLRDLAVQDVVFEFDRHPERDTTILFDTRNHPVIGTFVLRQENLAIEAFLDRDFVGETIPFPGADNPEACVVDELDAIVFDRACPEPIEGALTVRAALGVSLIGGELEFDLPLFLFLGHFPDGLIADRLTVVHLGGPNLGFVEGRGLVCDEEILLAASIAGVGLGDLVEIACVNLPED